MSLFTFSLGTASSVTKFVNLLTGKVKTTKISGAVKSQHVITGKVLNQIEGSVTVSVGAGKVVTQTVVSGKLK